MSGSNLYSGGTTLAGGTIEVGSSTALGSAPLTMSSDTVLAFQGSFTIANGIIFNGTSDPAIDTGANNVTLTGVISGPDALTKVGAGTLILTGMNTYIGQTSVSQGTLVVDGSSGGYTNTAFTVKSGGGTGTFENIFGTLYAGARYGAVDIRLGASYGGTATNLRRTVAFPGFNETERSSNDGNTVQGFGEVGYRLAFGETVVEPVVGGSITHVHQDSFREKGGAAALVGFAQDTDVGSTTVGVRGEATPFPSLPLVARLFLGWQHAYGDINPASTIAFASGSARFETYGTPLDRNSVVAETGFDYRATDALSIGIAYTGQAGRHDRDNAVKGRMEYRF